MSLLQLDHGATATTDVQLSVPLHAPPEEGSRSLPAAHRALLATLLLVTGVLYLWNLNVSGFANQYYSAAALAGSQSWKALFFGALDAGGAITVDKPPLAIWPMALSVKVFGLSSWSILVPQALEGVAAVAFLYAAVRRSTSSAGAALLAGTVFAVTPVCVLMFRYNNPDALLTLMMVAASYTTVRSLDSRRALAWLALTGGLVGTAFMCKLLQAFMILPSLALVYLLFAAAPLGRRVTHLLVAAGTTAVAAGWWMVTVDLWSSSSRPWIGGSVGNSVLELALGYNGVGRLTGHGSAASSSPGWHGTNLPRMVGVHVWTGVMWLAPAAIVMTAAAVHVAHHSPRHRSTDAAIWLWSSWLVVNTVVFCLMAGIFHAYYTIVLAPAIAALVGVSGLVLWRARNRRAVAWALTVASAATTVVAVSLQASHPGQMTGLAPWVWGLGLASMALLMVHVVSTRAAQAIVVIALASALLGPAAYGFATAATPHAGSGPQAGPHEDQINKPLSPAVVAALSNHADRYSWVAAVPGARTSSAYQLASRHPVIGIGGYKQSDPSPGLDQFRSWVHSGRIHYFIDAPSSGPAPNAIKAWVRTHFTSEHLGDQTVYDLTHGL